MFENYPKTRPELPTEHQAIYEAHYKENREGGSPASSLSRRMESWLHRQVATDATAGKSTLEIGAGTLNQLDYEPASEPYDIVEPFESLYRGSPLLGQIRNVYDDIAEIAGEEIYDRITAVATFEHVCALPEVVARAGLLLRPGGVLRASIPSEGTLLWTLGWKLTTGLEYRMRHGLDYGRLIAHEHVNTAAEIETVMRHFFRHVDCRVFGLSRAVSFYQHFAGTEPDRQRCRDYLATLPSLADGRSGRELPGSET